MIRPFTVFCKLNRISFSDRQWFEQEAGSLSHTDGICPACHAEASLSPFASYTRYLVEWAEKGGMEALVPRTRCDKGGTRVIPEEAKREVPRLKKEYPRLNATQIRKKCCGG